MNDHLSVFGRSGAVTAAVPELAGAGVSGNTSSEGG